MEKFRCPTCLTLLEGDELRCPACRSRLRKRGRPIVLGEASRLTSRPLFPLERDMRARVEAASAPDHPWRHEHISVTAPPRRPEPVPDLTPTIAALPEAEVLPAPEVMPERETLSQQEALEALLAFEATITADPADETVTPFWVQDPEPIAADIDLTDDAPVELPETAYHPVDIDLTTEPEPEPVSQLFSEPVWQWPTSSTAPVTLSSVPMPTPGSVDRIARDNGEIHEIFEALHRKARAEQDDDETAPVSLSTASVWPETTRATRLSATRARGRRRWNLEFLTRRSGSDADYS